MNVTYFLNAYHSKRDRSGNVYWAFTFIDADTQKIVAEGTVSGGESNIRSIMFGFSSPDKWDRSILFDDTEMPIRQFDRMVKEWKYAGCTREQLQSFIKSNL
jgi:hypothetical protein